MKKILWLPIVDLSKTSKIAKGQFKYMSENKECKTMQNLLNCDFFISQFSNIFKFNEILNQSDLNLNWDDYAFLKLLRKHFKNNTNLDELSFKFDLKLINVFIIHFIFLLIYYKFKNLVKNKIEKIDQQIFEQFKLCKKNGWEGCKVNWSVCKKRSINLYLKNIGKIKVTIRLYKLKDANNKTVYIYPAFLLLNINKDGILDGQREEMLLTYIETKSIRKTAKMYGMNKNLAHRLIKSVQEKEIKITSPITLEKTTLIVNVDGLWINNNWKSKKEIVETVGVFNKKRELLSVSLFTISQQKETDQRQAENKISYWFDEQKSLHENYDDLKVKIKTWYPNVDKLVVIGDGATWIKGMADYLGAEYVMDNYHYMATLISNWAKLIGGNRKAQKLIKKFKKDFYKLVNEGKDFNEIILEITALFDENTGELLLNNKNIPSIFEYNYKHFAEFKKALNLNYISIIEAEQSRLVASYLRYRRACFGITMVKKIRMIAFLIYNKFSTYINVTDLIKSIWCKNQPKNDSNPGSCNMISGEVSYIANSKETSKNGSWVTKKVKSDY